MEGTLLTPGRGGLIFIIIAIGLFNFYVIASLENKIISKKKNHIVSKFFIAFIAAVFKYFLLLALKFILKPVYPLHIF